MYDILQDALDDLVSTRSSLSRKGRALNTLERLIASIYVPKDPTALAALQTFISLQDTFQCNVPSRILVWLSATTSRLDTITTEGSLEPERHTEIPTLASQLVQALYMIQGILLSHAGSKDCLGRRHALEILVHLFLVSRRVPPPKAVTPRSVSTPSSTPAGGESKAKDVGAISLTSTVLDTLSCILVDSSPSLRAFEDVGGLKSVVKIMKRQGTTREVKIKCMEFLYFYVNAENPTWTRPAESSSSPSGSPGAGELHIVPTAPSSPTGVRPTHRPALSITQIPSRAASLSSECTPARSAAGRAVSTTSQESSPNSPLNIPVAQKLRTQSSRAPSTGGISTPKKVQPAPSTPIKYPKTPRKALQPLNVAHRRLSRDNDALALETPPRQHALPRAMPVQSRYNRGHRRAQSSFDVLSSPVSPPPTSPLPPLPETPHTPSPSDSERTKIRTMEEKKELLKGMISNVDGLLEQMSRLGISGLA